MSLDDFFDMEKLKDFPKQDYEWDVTEGGQMNAKDMETLIYVFGKENVIVFDEVHKMTGTVTRVVTMKSFGFVTGEDKQDYFFHRTDFNGFYDDLVVDLEKKQVIKVTFEPASTDKGLRARNVTRVDGGAPLD